MCGGLSTFALGAYSVNVKHSVGRTVNGWIHTYTVDTSYELKLWRTANYKLNDV